MDTVNVHDAKTNFSRLLERAEGGEEILIAKAGRPVARLGPLTRRGIKRRLGLLDAKRYRIPEPEDFNAPLPEDVLAAFEGRSR